MKFYIDSDYKCHVSLSDTYHEVEDSFFDDKCDIFIEGYRYVPAGETWVRNDGIEFTGIMITPWKDYEGLYTAQLEYEIEQYKNVLTEIETALNIEE